MYEDDDYENNDYDVFPDIPKNPYTMRKVASIINNPKFGRNKLLKLLRSHGIIDDSNKVNPVYSEEFYFEEVRSNGHCPYSTMQFISLRAKPQGITLIKKLIDSENCESISA
jgi:hypothetical protein